MSSHAAEQGLVLPCLLSKAVPASTASKQGGWRAHPLVTSHSRRNLTSNNLTGSVPQEYGDEGAFPALKSAWVPCSLVRWCSSGAVCRHYSCPVYLVQGAVWKPYAVRRGAGGPCGQGMGLHQSRCASLGLQGHVRVQTNPPCCLHCRFAMTSTRRGTELSMHGAAATPTQRFCTALRMMHVSSGKIESCARGAGQAYDRPLPVRPIVQRLCAPAPPPPPPTGTEVLLQQRDLITNWEEFTRKNFRNLFKGWTAAELATVCSWSTVKCVDGNVAEL